ALESYQQALLGIAEAAAACPQWHPDRMVLEEHLAQVETRMDYLQGLQGAAATIPCDRHMAPKQLTVAGSQGAIGSRTLGFTALMGAVAGLLVAGPRAALLLAAGAAHTATMDNSAGHLARLLGLRGSEVLTLAGKRAAAKLERLDTRETRQMALCHVGQTVFALRAALGAAFVTPWRPPAA
ncbi:unnamed protein product, partial [Polarella glacialis]